VSVERRRLQTLWPGEDDIVPLASAARIGHNGEQVTRGAMPARIARPPRLTAADFTPERMLRSKARPPADGWRRAVYVATRGAVAVGPSVAECHRRELVVQVTTPITGCRTVAFVSRKGGVGKTTTCLLVGNTFASHRGDCSNALLCLGADSEAPWLRVRALFVAYLQVLQLIREPRTRLQVVCVITASPSQATPRCAEAATAAGLRARSASVLNSERFGRSRAVGHTL
jgi:hypothetical protein